METFARDLTYGLRLLVRDKAFTLTALLTLSLCIGANTAVFTVVSSVLLRPLPVPESERVLLLYNSYPKAGVVRAITSAGDYYDRLRDLTVFEEQALYQLYQGVAVGEAGSVNQVTATGVTPSFFRLLRAKPLLGRVFDDAEGELGAERKAILSYAFWQKQGGDMAIVGRDLRLGGEPYRVVGVMPPGFFFLEPDVALWRPLAFTEEQKNERHSNNWEMIARLKPGAIREQAQAQVDALNARNLERFPEMKTILVNAGFHTRVVGLQEEVVRDVRGTLFLLWGGALFVLLIGAVNVANLTLARSSARLRELATRLALGATRQALARQLGAESLLLSLVAAGAGLLIGYGAVRGLARAGLDGIPRFSEIGVDATVVGFVLLLSTLVGLGIASLSVVHALYADPSAVLRGEGGRTGSRGRAARAWRKGLVAAQLAFALVLLTGAGLLFSSFRQVLAVKPGFDPTEVVTGSVLMPRSRYADDPTRAAFVDRLLEQVRALPGVVAAGVVDNLPFSGEGSDSVIVAEGYQMAPGESLVSPNQAAVTPGYFEAMRVPLVEGRFFDERDRPGAPAVVIVDDRLARRFWPGESPIGKRMWRPKSAEALSAPDESNTERFTVAGVVGSVKLRALVDPDERVGAYYFPFAQQPQSYVSLAVRSSAGTAGVTSGLRQALASLDPELPLANVRTMSDRIEGSLASRRAPVLLSVGFGAVALLLAAVGLYGVLAYLVAQRTREIGVRMALGSTTAQVFALVARESGLILGAGFGAGLLGASALAHAIRSMLYEVTPLDPLVLASACAVLGVVALAASTLPAWRAARVNPVVALRHE
jgi:predicted permease